MYIYRYKDPYVKCDSWWEFLFKAVHCDMNAAIDWLRKEIVEKPSKTPQLSSIEQCPNTNSNVSSTANIEQRGERIDRMERCDVINNFRLTLLLFIFFINVVEAFCTCPKREQKSRRFHRNKEKMFEGVLDWTEICWAAPMASAVEWHLSDSKAGNPNRFALMIWKPEEIYEHFLFTLCCFGIILLPWNILPTLVLLHRRSGEWYWKQNQYWTYHLKIPKLFI